jgi:hypothetical protein
MPGAAVKHVSTADLAPPGFLLWHEVALPAVTQMHLVHCPAPATGTAVRAGHLLRWVAPLCVFRRETSGLAVGALASTTCNNFIADLLFLSEVSHPFLVAAPPLRTPLFGEISPAKMGRKPQPQPGIWPLARLWLWPLVLGF